MVLSPECESFSFWHSSNVTEKAFEFWKRRPGRHTLLICQIRPVSTLAVLDNYLLNEQFAEDWTIETRSDKYSEDEKYIEPVGSDFVLGQLITD
jgi:hypothetical protein